MEQETLKENGLSFLYKKCVKITPGVLSRIALVPEFREALKSYSGSLTDDSVYEIIRKEYQKMLSENREYRTARRVMNQVSRDVKGDSMAWKSE